LVCPIIKFDMAETVLNTEVKRLSRVEGAAYIGIYVLFVLYLPRILTF
jgi:hypothetical protein